MTMVKVLKVAGVGVYGGGWLVAAGVALMLASNSIIQ